MSATNDRIVAAALAAVGMSGSPANREAFAAFLADGQDTPDIGLQMTTASTCALVARTLWRRAGVDMPGLYEPYPIGSGPSALVAFAESVNAWHTTDLLSAVAGDLVLVGEGGQAHVFTLTDDANDERFHSVDGGQLDPAGYQLVQGKERHWNPPNRVGQTIDISRPIGFAQWGIQRPVIGFVAVAGLPVRS